MDYRIPGAGSRFSRTQQLEAVSVEDEIDTATPRALRYYILDYVRSPSGNPGDVLQAITECSDASRSVCYRPTRFQWSTARYHFAPSTDQIGSGADFNGLVSYRLGDVDGDGRLDVVGWKRDATCGGTSSAPHSRLIVGFSDHDAAGRLHLERRQLPFCAPRDLTNADDAWQLFDYTGDGRDDLLVAGAAGSRWALHAAHARLSDRHSAFDTHVDLLDAAHDNTLIPVPADDFRRSQLADFNGDGLLDVLYPVQDAPTAQYGAMDVRFLERQPSGRYAFSPPHRLVVTWADGDPCATAGQSTDDPISCTLDFFANRPKRLGVASDFNADGRADLLFRVTRVYDTQCTTCRPGDGRALYATDTMHSDRARLRRAWYLFTTGVRTTGEDEPPTLTLRAMWGAASAQAGGDLPDTAEHLHLADFNGDGLADLLYREAGTVDRYRFRINAGAALLPSEAAGVVERADALQLVDVDNDGRSEILHPGAADGVFRMRRWQPSADNSAGQFGPSVVLPGGGATAPPGNDWVGLFADFDGDGAADHVRLKVARTAGAVLHASRGTPSDRHHPRGVVTQVTNGYGAATRVTYQPLTNAAIYRPDRESRNRVSWGRGSPVQDLLGPVTVVARAESSAPRIDAPLATSQLYYRYSGAKLQGGGRGFLGFRQVSTVDPNDGADGQPHYTETQSDYLQAFPYIGSAQSSVRRIGSTRFAPSPCLADPESAAGCFHDVGTVGWSPAQGPVVYEAISLWACQVPGDSSGCAPPWGSLGQCPAAGASGSLHRLLLASRSGILSAFRAQGEARPILAFAAGSSEQTRDAESGRILAVHNHVTCYEDGFGNATRAITEHLDGDGQTVAREESTHAYRNVAEPWRIGRLTHSTSRMTRPGEPPVERGTRFAYDLDSPAQTGLLTREQVQPGLRDQDLSQAYVHDAFGNRTLEWQCSGEVSREHCDDASDTDRVAHRPVQEGDEPSPVVHRYQRTRFDTRLPVDRQRGRFADEQSIRCTPLVRHRLRRSTSAASCSGATRSATLSASATRTVARVAPCSARWDARSTAGSRPARPTPHAPVKPFGCAGAPAAAMEPLFRVRPGQPFAKRSFPIRRRRSGVYHDVLGRITAQVTQTFNAGVPGADLSGTCTGYDAHGRVIHDSIPAFLDGSGEPSFLPGINQDFCTGEQPATQTHFDAQGRTVAVVAPDLSITTTRYQDNETIVTDPRRSVLVQRRNALGELVRTVDAAGLVVTYRYTADGGTRRVTRDGGNGAIDSVAVFDALGRKIRQSDPDSGTRHFAYNAAGERLRSTDATGQVIRYHRDALGRIWQRSSQASPCTPSSCGLDAISRTTDRYTYDVAINGLGLLAQGSREDDGRVTYLRDHHYDALARSNIEKPPSTAGAGPSTHAMTPLAARSRSRMRRAIR
ncbi:hypothetical protein PEC18_34955 [Paucibacter sp. O1-1]|nr:hypothetical protein [Paucibacter sp. O1-1]MDA3830876.1 hypothetical protein [Paucibacter sp. O1-1]